MARIIFIIVGLFLSGSILAQQKLTVILDWFINPNHAPIFIAQEKGIFKKNGVTVEIVVPADPTDPPKWVAIGRGDIALDYQPQTVIAMTKNLPIKQVGTLIKSPLSVLVVLKSSHINRLADLKGKAIAYSSPAIDLPLLEKILAGSHLTLKDVVLINVHYELLQALLSKKVIAAVGMMRNLELIQLTLLGQEYQAFFPEQYGIPPYSELVFIAHKAGNEAKFAAFFKSIDEAVAYIRAHPSLSWQEFSSHHKELNNALNEQAWLKTIPYFAKRSASVDQKQMQQLTDLLQPKNR